MKEKESTLKRLKILPILFRKQDAEKVARHSEIFLNRAVKKGLIHRINRGSYINSFLYGFPQVEQVACFLRPPAYVSCEWALNHHGILLQAPYVCSTVTLGSSVGKSRSVIYKGIIIEFSRIAPKLFEGFSFENGVYMASPEKAILDTLYYRGKIPAEDEMELADVDFASLLKMSEKYPAVIRRRVQLLFEPTR
jgi:predicted transcriptional regulator of viral defense system